MTAHHFRKLAPDDAQAFVDLRLEMLGDSPFSFIGAPGEDGGVAVEVMVERFSHPTNATMGAFASDGRLVAVVGFFRMVQVKLRHKGYIVSVYTSPKDRGRGVARRLLEMAIEHAEGLEGLDILQLAVSTTAPEAQALYESMGFRMWGTEPHAIRVAAGDTGEVGEASEIHMWRPL